MTASRRLLAIAALALLAALFLVLRGPGMPLGGPPAVTTAAEGTDAPTAPATVTETHGFMARQGLDPAATAVNEEPVGDLNALWSTGNLPDEDAQLVRDEFIRGFLHDGNTERHISVYLPSTRGAETFACTRDIDVIRCQGPETEVFIA